MNDFLHYAMMRATGYYSGNEPNDGVFSLASLAHAIADAGQFNGRADGELLRLLLVGRPDCAPLRGGCHYIFLEAERATRKDKP